MRGWAMGALVLLLIVVGVMLCRAAFGLGDRRRDRAELRRAAQRAEGEE